jgi:hypothetical protein
MSPDIHWDVGEDAEPETIAQTTASRRSRRGWLAVLIVVILGASLGVVYRSIPEPAPRLTPTPVPTLPATPVRPAVPVALYQTIDHEAQALADGDFEAFLDTHMSFLPGKIEAQQQNFTAWGRPGDDRPLYAIIDFKLRTDRHAWVDIRQFRNGRSFRETRFYYRENDRWLRSSQPDISLWSGQTETILTPHFDVTYAIEDRDLISPTVRQLEEDYRALCRDLGCASSGQELTFTLKMNVNNGPDPYAVPVGGGHRELRLSSPRVTGFFESGRAYTWESRFTPHGVLADEIVKRAYGLRFDGAADFDQPGGGLLGAGIFWAIDHIDPLPAEFLDTWGDLQQKPLLSLEVLWEIGGVDEPGLAVVQLYHLLRFIEQEYGASAVTRLLGTIHAVKSLPDAIETGLNVPFTEFDQKWQAWAKQNIGSH